MLILPLMGVSPQKIVVDDDVLSPIVILWVACGAFFLLREMWEMRSLVARRGLNESGLEQMVMMYKRDEDGKGKK